MILKLQGGFRAHHVKTMAPSATNNYEEFYPAAFPKEVPTIQLAKISVAKLLDGDEKEAETLFHVCSHEGFFYLDLTTESRGKKFSSEADELHHVAKEVFETVSIDEKLAFKTNDATGHLDTG